MGRPRKQKVEELKETKRIPVGLANYGANENRRTCQACGSIDSRVNRTRKVGRMIVRYRSCTKCNRNRITTEIVE